MEIIFWLITSYLLGSIPFGYLFARMSGKNILEIGWRKTSGSNVFKNVGKWQGAATGFFDVGKGYIAVYGAQKLGLPIEIQALSGVAAVTGHNWSVFLKFAGGRGIGTFIGALWVLNPFILLLSIFPLLIFAVAWDAAIATILFLAAVIVLSLGLDLFSSSGLLAFASLAPIFIKRLSPIKEIFSAKNPAILILNRLIFDDDIAHDFRISRIASKTKNNSGKMFKMAKPIADPILTQSKIGFKAAKYGVKAAARPLQKLIFPEQEKVITELGVKDVKKLMKAAAQKVVAHQEEINRINVFPVADKDTGYNLAATLLGIEGVIDRKNYDSLEELAKDIKDAAMTNARGNSGMIFAGYLMRVLDEIKNLKTVNAKRLARAMRKGMKGARLSIHSPVEGTILDVIKAAGIAAFVAAKKRKEGNIIKVLEEAYQSSKIALAETKEKLPVLKENDVVDAGALGFVKILEAWLECLKGAPLEKEESFPEMKFESMPVFKESAPAFRYDVQFSFKMPEAENLENIKKELPRLGDSIDLLYSQEKVKVHIHTNATEELKEKFKFFPDFEWRVEDLILQTRGGPKKPLGLVIGDTAAVPKKFLEENQIETVPFQVNFPSAGTQHLENIYKKMCQTKKIPTTSAPAFGAYFNHYKRSLEKAEKILILTPSSKLSAAYSQARIARSLFKKPEKNNIFVFDCFTFDAAEGLIAMKTQELISQSKTTEEIVGYLNDFCPKIKLLGAIDDVQYLIRGGRLKLPGFLAPIISALQKNSFRLVLELTDGKIKLAKIKFGANLPKILAEEVREAAGGRKIKVIITHSDNQEAADELKNILEQELGAEILFVSQVSPVIGVHTGPGAVICAFHAIDK